MNSDQSQIFNEFIGEPIGIIINGATLERFDFVVNPDYRNKIMFGEYVLTRDAYGNLIFGVVESLIGANKLLSIYENQGITKEELQTIINSTELKDISEMVIAEVQVLGKIQLEIHEGSKYSVSIRAIRYPIVPLSEVYLPSEKLLKIIFEEGLESSEDRISIGYLLNFYDYNTDRGSVKVYLDVNKLLSRHFAILAVTGAGKTNTVLVLASKLVEEFNGTVIVFDYHGEYTTLGDDDVRNSLPFDVNVIKNPALRVEDLRFEDLQKLLGIGSKNVNMIDALKRAYDEVERESQYNSEIRRGKNFIEALKKYLEDLSEGIIDSNQNVRNGAFRVLRNLKLKEDLLRRILYDENKTDVIRSLRAGSLNIIDLSSLTDDEAIIIVSSLARTVLKVRSKIARGGRTPPDILTPAFQYPLVLIIEEAHVFLDPEKAQESAYWLSRIAREGRKFGISLGIVSQRPKRLETDVLSQCNTFIILKLIEERDRRTVKNSSEMITERLADALTTLDVGEALIIGYAVPARIPVTVKVFDFKKLYENARYGGLDINFTKEWKKIGASLRSPIDINELPM